MAVHDEDDRYRTSRPHRSLGPRKAYRACVACVNSKIRCQDVIFPEGCLRCRTKSRHCSLASARDPSDIGRSDVGDDGLLLCRMRALEEELTDMRKLMLSVQEDIRERPATRPDSGQSSESSHTTTSRPIRTTQLASVLNWRKSHMSDGLFSLSSGDSFPDPTRSSLFTLDQLERVFEIFKVRLTQRYPITPYSMMSSPLPRHPFVRLAIAAHALAPSSIFPLIETSFVAAATSPATVDVLLALLILSLAPFPTDCLKAPITSLRYISLAYSLGQAMGLDTIAYTNIASPWLVHEPWAQKLTDILLPFEIDSSCCMQSRLSNMNTTFGAAQLPRYLPQQYDLVIRNLLAERELFAIVASLLSDIGKAESELNVDICGLSNMMSTWVSVNSALIAWRNQPGPSSGLLLLDSYALSFSIALRLCFVVQAIPMPLNPDHRFSFQSLTGIAVMQQALSLCDHVNSVTEDELSTLPAYIVSQFVVAVSVQLRALDFATAMGDTGDILSRSVADTATNKILNVIAGLPAIMLRDVRAQISTVQHTAPSAPGIDNTDYNYLFDAMPPHFWESLISGEDADPFKAMSNLLNPTPFGSSLAE